MPENSFFHKEYDPVKAHNYYMEVRKLKGKKPGGPPPPVHRQKGSSSSSSSGRHVPSKAQFAKKNPKQLRSEADARVASIRVRLGKLTAHLDKLMKEAVARDDAKSKSKPKDAKSSTPQKTSDSKLTAAQKQQKQVADKKYYEDHKKPAAAKTAASTPSEKDHQAEIDRVKAQIVQVRAQLRAAILKAKQATNNKTTVPGR
jgi:hypothetical protein